MIFEEREWGLPDTEALCDAGDDVVGGGEGDGEDERELFGVEFD